MCSAVWALAASCLVLYRMRAVPWVRFRWNVSSGPCCMQIVLKVDPSIWGRTARMKQMFVIISPNILQSWLRHSNGKIFCSQEEKQMKAVGISKGDRSWFLNRNWYALTSHNYIEFALVWNNLNYLSCSLTVWVQFSLSHCVSYTATTLTLTAFPVIIYNLYFSPSSVIEICTKGTRMS